MCLTLNCPCGNNDPLKTVTYNGAIGYEAIICQVCARTHDNNGIHEADHISIANMLSKSKIPYPSADINDLRITPVYRMNTKSILLSIEYKKRTCLCSSLPDGLRYVGYSRDNLLPVIALIEGKEIEIIRG